MRTTWEINSVRETKQCVWQEQTVAQLHARPLQIRHAILQQGLE